MIDLEQTHKLSMHNRSAIGDAEHASCFFCIRVFPSSAVTEWTDNGTTALCPNCEVDALLPGKHSTEDLAAMCERWFTGRDSAQTVSPEPPK